VGYTLETVALMVLSVGGMDADCCVASSISPSIIKVAWCATGFTRAKKN